MSKLVRRYSMTGRVFIVQFAVRIVRSIAWSLVHHECSPSYCNATKVSFGAPHYLSAYYLSAYSANGSKKRLRPSRFEKCLGLSVMKKRTGIGLLEGSHSTACCEAKALRRPSPGAGSMIVRRGTDRTRPRHDA